MEKMISEGAVPKECEYLNHTTIEPIRPFKTVNKEKRLEMIKIWKSKKKILKSSE